MIKVYENKQYLIEKLIIYLKKELNYEYTNYTIKDMNNNIADILVKKDSKIFNEYIKGKEYINFEIEELIDKRSFDNEYEIIIINYNFENGINLEYIQNTLKYNYLTYSKKVKEKLETFINYIFEKNGHI